ncbi:hypothetical protein SF12_04525 [Streptomyces sp. MBRL 601]|nr:hypothetical protein SF12_04525 [Streptomyces sp. MBRL 601]
MGEGAQEQVGEVGGDLLRGERAVGAVPGGEVVDGAEVVVDHQVGGDVAGEHPGLLALLDQGAEPLVVTPPLGPDLLVLLRAQLVDGAEEDGGVVEVLDGGDDHVGGGRAQPLLDGLLGARVHVEAFLLESQQPGVDLLEEVLLGAEVVVEGALGDAGRLHDLLDGGPVVPLVGEEAGGGGQQPPGYGRAVALRVSGRVLGHCAPPPSSSLPLDAAFGLVAAGTGATG